MSDREIHIAIHVTPENIEKKEYVCNENNCKKNFNNEQNLKKHVNQHYGESDKTVKIIYQYCCPVNSCRRHITKDYFTSRKHLTQHFFKVHNTKKFICSNKNCDKRFSTNILRNLHLKNCGKSFVCNVCNAKYNSTEALLTHRKRKNHSLENEFQKEKIQITSNKKNASTATVTSSSQTSPSKDSSQMSPSKVITSESKSTITDDFFTNQPCTSSSLKSIKSISTSTSDDFIKEDNSNSLSSSSSNNKTTNVNWLVNGGEFEEDSVTLFDNDVKMEFYSAETQTDFSESLFNNNYTQTTFADFYDFEKFDKFDSQTQTNWDEFNQGF